jgi:hypothetical protein
MLGAVARRFGHIELSGPAQWISYHFACVTKVHRGDASERKDRRGGTIDP